MTMGEMGLTMGERKSVVQVMAKGYWKVGKKEKGRILDEVVALSGYNRWYAVGLLRGHGKAIKVGRRLRLVGDLGRSMRRSVPRIYDGAVREWLKKIWAILDFICGKRLDRERSGHQQGPGVGVRSAERYPRPAAVPAARHRFGQWLGIHQ